MIKVVAGVEGTAVRGNSTKRLARSVIKNAKFLLSRVVTVRSTAKNVIPSARIAAADPSDGRDF